MESRSFGLAGLLFLAIIWGCGTTPGNKASTGHTTHSSPITAVPAVAPTSVPSSEGTDSAFSTAKPHPAGKGITGTAATIHRNSGSMVGRWADQYGAIYNFKKDGQVFWSRPVGKSNATFKGKYTLLYNELVIVPKGVTSENSEVKKQVAPSLQTHRIRDFRVTWSPDGSSLTLSGRDMKLTFTAVK